ncbi:hypothetical protein ACTJI2_11515 [Pseudoxanthomonas sp. 22568]|uniref:hypothetical protein n=1 Tax=Pseudoxanthomonas sp. 22568 TaxID=3453945 RepID=UPI003F82F4E8
MVVRELLPCTGDDSAGVRLSVSVAKAFPAINSDATAMLIAMANVEVLHVAHVDDRRALVVETGLSLPVVRFPRMAGMEWRIFETPFS